MIFLGMQGTLSAQFTPGGIDFPDNYSSEPQGEYELLPDTSDVFYFYADNPGEDFVFSDSLLGGYFHQLDPTRQRDLDYVNLGNLGSAARPLVYEPIYRRGFDVGQHQFDIYQTPAPDLPFYRLERAFTNVAYYQLADQADSYFTGQFSRDFADGINFSVDYKRISQIGRRNQFPNQNTRNTALATGVWYHSKDDSYDGFFSIAWNTIEQENNGGIIQGPQAEQGFESPNSAQVFLEEAQSRHRHRSLSYTHYYNFGRAGKTPQGPPRRATGIPRLVPDSIQQQKPPRAAVQDSLRRKIVSADSLKNNPPPRGYEADRSFPTGSTAAVAPKRRFTLAHRIYYRSNIYKYFDEDVDRQRAIDYYGDFLVDTRGLRFFLDHRMLENTFRLRTSKALAAGAGEAQRQRDLLEVGLTSTFNWLDMEAGDSTVNNLFAFGRLHFQPSDRLRIRTYGHLGLWDNRGDYRAYGELFFDVGAVGQLTLTANNQLYEPNLIQQRFIVSQRPIWNNDFKKTLETNITATYSLPSWNLEISGRYHLLNNYIYFDSLAMPRQTGVPISIAQLIFKNKLSLGRIHFDNVVALQNSSESFIRMPDIFSKHSLYLDSKWFGVLNVQLGFDLRMNSTYQGYYYHPLTGQFILRDDPEVEFYPSVDGFIGMRVTKFRAFFKWANITSFLLEDRLFYLNTLYPFQTGAGFRFGIKWRFSD